MSDRTISIDALEREIGNWSKGYWTSGRNALAILEPVYAIPSSDDVAQFIDATKEAISSEDTHNTNIWDCDQYSRYVWVEAGKYASKLGFRYKWPLGLVSGYFKWVGDGRAHTCNWVYMVEGVALIEPQGFIIKRVGDIIERSIRIVLV